jgi:two-component system response regulator FlrC
MRTEDMASTVEKRVSAEDRLGTTGSRALALAWIFPDCTRPATRLDRPAIVIGRGSAQCDVVLQSELVSRRHARVVGSEGRYVIENLESRNGTYVNGLPRDEAEIVAGDVIRIGDWLAVVVDLSDNQSLAYGEALPGFFSGPETARVVEQARAAMQSDLPIVLVGETGSGKEAVARAIHLASGRVGAYVAVNCAVYSPGTAAAELFGYRRGAFTGAERAHVGHFRAADKGTLLLDEVADLNAEVQAQLLRSIEQREVLPLGESRPIPVDLRIIAAVQKPLGDYVRRGTFRFDLQARLEGLVIEIPPLRQRRSEIVPLFLHLRRGHAKDRPLPALSARAAERLCLHDWRQNVRELSLCASRVMAFRKRSGELTMNDLVEIHPALAGPGESALRTIDSLPPSKKPAFRPEDAEALKSSLEQSGGNLSQAARRLGITRHRAYRILKALDPRP